MQKQTALLEVAAKVKHRNDGAGDDFRIAHLASGIFAARQSLEQVSDKAVLQRHGRTSGVLCF